MQNSVTHNVQEQEYLVFLKQDLTARVSYERNDQILSITSTNVPKVLQGQGYGKVMMEAVLPVIESEGFKIIPICSYVIHYINKNPQWAHLVAE